MTLCSLISQLALAGPDVYGFGDGSGGPHAVAGLESVGAASPFVGSSTAGATTVGVGNGGLFGVGDLVVLHQTAGVNLGVTFVQPPADIDAAAVGVGHYEYARITAVTANLLTLDAPLVAGYSPGSQVVTVQEYSSLTLGVGATLTAPSWDGAAGGILAISVDGTVSLDGTIDMSGRGFWGAPQDGDPGYDGSCGANDENPANSSNKGGGFAGYAGVGRGTHGNAGGGGNCANAGGGGGGNGGHGGVGGNGWSGASGTPRGGFGGAAIASAADTARFVFGGGGGAGDGNNNIPDTLGAPGGGLVLLRARSVQGSGIVTARGADATTNRDDGAGGGGAGGSVLIRTLGTATCGSVDVSGGAGGDVDDGVLFGGEHGPGGGGGGGRAIVEGAGGCVVVANGGAAGQFDSSTPWGALDGEVGVSATTGPVMVDGDGDGVPAGPDSNALPDCDDADPAVAPGAPEVCDGIDNDCDTLIDEGAPGSTFYLDMDADGFGDPADPVSACSAPVGYVTNAQDCDDSDGTVNPSVVTDVCDGVDEDCDGTVDEDAAVLDWWVDGDSDGYGSGGLTSACAQPLGFAGTDDDCDDTAAGVHPNATEICNGIDDNCMGGIDEGLSSSWFADGDGDGFGDPTQQQQACAQPSGWVSNNTDCDDGVSGVNPGVGVDGCDGVDEDCDGATDEDTAFVDWWPDADGDGFGIGASTSACAQPSGHGALNGDCDDTDPVVNPSVTEICNAIDDDCDFEIDEGFQTLWYADDDDDGFGDPLDVTSSCVAPFDTVDESTDCDDADPAVNPSASEQCNGQDDDCDGTADNGVASQPWYPDADLDGYGVPAGAIVDCAAPPGFAATDDDCNDGVAAINPGAVEQCNLLDDDCDGFADNGSPMNATWYLDGDGDGVGGDADTQLECFAPTPDHVLDGGDCDDADPGVSPTEFEICGGADEDCDGLVDDLDPGVIDATPWYLDSDGDGFGDGPPVFSCVQPSGHVASNTDCDDNDPNRSPDALEVCDSIDNDCDGAIDDADDDVQGAVWYTDADGDGVGSPVVDTSTCNGGVGLAPLDGDCDDTDPDVHSGAQEFCDGVDANCDGVIHGEQRFTDADADGFGGLALWTCTSEGVSNDLDCDDANDHIYPGATEVPGDGIDQDCDGSDLVPQDTGVPTTDTAHTAHTGAAAPPNHSSTGCGCESAPRTFGWGTLIPMRRR